MAPPVESLCYSNMSARRCILLYLTLMQIPMAHHRLQRSCESWIGVLSRARTDEKSQITTRATRSHRRPRRITYYLFGSVMAPSRRPSYHRGSKTSRCIHDSPLKIPIVFHVPSSGPGRVLAPLSSRFSFPHSRKIARVKATDTHVVRRGTLPCN